MVLAGRRRASAHSVNRAVSTIVGYQPEQLLGRSLLDFLHPDDVTRARAIVEAARQQGSGWTDVELRWQHRNGTTVRLQGSGTVVTDATGTVGFRGARRPSPTPARRANVAAARRRVQDLLTTRGLTLALQPIISADGEVWTGAEALARFPDGRGPDQWFADAELAGLGVELEMLAIESALDQLPTLPAEVTLSVNASPAVVLDPRLPHVLAAHRHDLARITLEITEHTAVSAYDDIRDALLPWRGAGLTLAIDDTGAGYASFTHVLRLRPDVIKIDRSLIAGIDADPGRRALVTAIVLLALELDATVTAEGVETADELDTVRHLAVDEVQGYYLARPTTCRATWSSWESSSWSRPRGAGGPPSDQGSLPTDQEQVSLAPVMFGVSYAERVTSFARSGNNTEGTQMIT